MEWKDIYLLHYTCSYIWLQIIWTTMAKNVRTKFLYAIIKRATHHKCPSIHTDNLINNPHWKYLPS